MRTGTLWFNPPPVNIDVAPNTQSARSASQPNTRKQSVANIDPDPRISTKKRRKRSLKQKQAHAKKLILIQKAKLA